MRNLTAAGMTSMIDRVDTVLVGRIGFQEWKGYWPKVQRGDPCGDFINPVEEFVASRTLTGEQEWQNTSVIDETLEQFVTAQKNLAGGEISVCGSISVVRQLFFAGLLDSLTLMMHSVIAGAGRHVFEPTAPVTRLILQPHEARQRAIHSSATACVRCDQVKCVSNSGAHDPSSPSPINQQ